MHKCKRQAVAYKKATTAAATRNFLSVIRLKALHEKHISVTNATLTHHLFENVIKPINDFLSYFLYR